ncbi:MAG: hypothetical protein AAGP08_06130 [Pseudomonadota bacterium]
MRILAAVFAMVLSTPSFAAPLSQPYPRVSVPWITPTQAKPGRENEYKEKKAELEKVLKTKEAFLEKHLRKGLDRSKLEEAEVAYMFYIRTRKFPFIFWPLEEKEFPKPKTAKEKAEYQAERERYQREKKIIDPLTKAFFEGLDLSLAKEDEFDFRGRMFRRYQQLMAQVTACRQELAKMSQ